VKIEISIILEAINLQIIKQSKQKIIASDLLIAVVDEYWTSSTWKLHEIFFALGDYKGMGTTKRIPNSTDVVLFFSENISIPF
jgi:hypothetical protein